MASSDLVVGQAALLSYDKIVQPFLNPSSPRGNLVSIRDAEADAIG